MVDILFYFY